MSPAVIGAEAAALAYLCLSLGCDWAAGRTGPAGEAARTFALLRGEVAPEPRGLMHRWRRAWLSPGVRWQPREYVLPLASAWAMLFLAGWTILRSPLPALPVSVALLLVYRRILLRQLERRYRERLNFQLRDGLQSLVASLRAGASLPRAFERSLEDLRQVLAGQPRAPVVEEFGRIVHELRLGFPLEEALVRFRERAGLEDVDDFVNAVLLCQVRGGKLTEVVGSIAEMIGDRIGVRHRVRVLTAGKRLESRVLTIAPPAVVAFTALTSPEYLAPLFETTVGQVLMLVATGFLIAAYFIGQRIVDIQI